MVRLVFRPYAQIRQSICTSEALRTSTRVSSGFVLPKHSSPSFGSQPVRSDSASPNCCDVETGRRCARGARPAGSRPCDQLAAATLTGRRGLAGARPGADHPATSGRPGVGRRRPRARRSPAGCGPPRGCSPKTTEARERDRRFHFAFGVRTCPMTRAQVRLLGPCFKTGRVGCRHRRRPLMSFREPIPTLATRGIRVRTEDSPTRLTSRRGRGAPRANSRHSGHFVLGPGKRRGWSRGAVKNRTEVLFHLRPQPFQADPEPVAAHHRRRKCARRRPSPTGTRSPEGDPRTPERPTLVRVESSGQTARTPPVYLLTVSRPLELSLQSSFQLSLKVLVDYRSHAGI